MEAVVVFITVPGEDEAARISAALLDARLAACVNRAEVHSEFWWRGGKEGACEVLLMAKTRRELWPEVLETVRANHSYEVFEAVAVPIIEANPDYLRWIHETTLQKSAG